MGNSSSLYNIIKTFNILQKFSKNLYRKLNFSSILLDKKSDSFISFSVKVDLLDTKSGTILK